MTSAQNSWTCDRARLVIELSELRRNYIRLSTALSGIPLHFAVKCLPELSTLRELARLGCKFEVASAGEIELLRDAGLLDSDVVFSAPIKPVSDIRRAYELGVRRFVADSMMELQKLSAHAPAADVFIRLAVDSDGSLMPLSQKFGVGQTEAVDLALRATRMGLKPVGLTFHVGSQAEELGVWQKAISLVGETMYTLAQQGVEITSIDLGGGFPVPYSRHVPTVEEIGRVIQEAIEQLPNGVTLSAEPGRYLAASAGELHADVVGIAERLGERWVYVNAGIYHGLAEAHPGIGGVSFSVRTNRTVPGACMVPSIVAGYSCDGTDVIGRDVPLPQDISVGDELVFANAGAYSLSYATAFCGIDAPVVEIVEAQ